MFTVVTHYEQKTFQVPIMSYINLVAYAQQKINNILHKVQAGVRAYIDNIVYNARLIPYLLNKLRVLFEIFLHYNISIKPIKLFLNYLNVGLLRQKVNSLGLTTSDKKLKAICFLAYLDTLGALKYYLGLIRYLQNYIHFYAQLIAPLQELKTLLLHHALVAGQQRKTYASKKKLGTSPLFSQSRTL